MDKTQLRVLDANFNRAREALRVVEDYARFFLDDKRLASLLKNMRHKLSRCMMQITPQNLLDARDIVGDVGTSINTEMEQQRADEISVLHAATKRLTEALRCLEEYGKIISPGLGIELEQIRYRAYDLEKQVLLRAQPAWYFKKVRLYVLLTEHLCRKPILDVARAVIDGGADCIQLRDKEKTDRELSGLGEKIAKICHDAGVLFIMNDRPDIAYLTGADGVHLGRQDLPVASARKIMPAGKIIGTSTHNLTEAEEAIAENPDYIAVGAVFASQTKPQVSIAGLDYIRQVRRQYSGPIIAIGGIDADNVRQVMLAGASGVALCGAVLACPDPGRCCRLIKEQIM